jgi:hypothetical protein
MKRAGLRSITENRSMEDYMITAVAAIVVVVWMFKV